MASGDIQWYTTSSINSCQYPSSSTDVKIFSTSIFDESTSLPSSKYSNSYRRVFNVVNKLVFHIDQQFVSSILLAVTLLLVLIIKPLSYPSNDQFLLQLFFPYFNFYHYYVLEHFLHSMHLMGHLLLLIMDH